MAVRVRIVTAVGDSEIDAQGNPGPDDLRLVHELQRGPNPKLQLAFDTGFRGQIGHSFEGLDEVRPAVRIPAVIDGIDTDEDVRSSQDLRPGKGIGQKDGVSGGNIGDRDLLLLLHRIERTGFGDGQIACQCRSADDMQIDLDDEVAPYTHAGSDAFGRLQLENVSLAIIETEGIQFETLLSGDGHGRCRIQSTARQDNGFRSVCLFR